MVSMLRTVLALLPLGARGIVTPSHFRDSACAHKIKACSGGVQTPCDGSNEASCTCYKADRGGGTYAKEMEENAAMLTLTQQMEVSNEEVMRDMAGDPVQVASSYFLVDESGSMTMYVLNEK